MDPCQGFIPCFQSSNPNRDKLKNRILLVVVLVSYAIFGSCLLMPPNLLPENLSVPQNISTEREREIGLIPSAIT